MSFLTRAVKSLVRRESGPSLAVNQEAQNSQQATARNYKKTETIDRDTQTKIDKLKSLWLLYSNINDENERTQQLFKILPPFISVYQKLDINQIIETFGERNLKQFTFVIAKKFVKDIKNTWKANLPPEVNSKNIVKLLSSNSEDGSFDILSALEIVCVTSSNVEVATDAGIPSTIVKIIHLLYSLPANSEFRKDPTVKGIFSLFQGIVKYRSVVMELLNTDTLFQLFTLMSTPCPLHNLIFKEKVLPAISPIIRLHTDKETLEYFHNKSCIRSIISALRNDIDHLPASF